MGTQSLPHPTRPTLCRLAAKILLALAVSGALAQTSTITALQQPSALAYDAQGNLYVAEAGNHVIRLISPADQLSTIAGTGIQGFSGDGQPATSAQLDSPQGLALDAHGNLYLADTHNHRIRRVDATTGIITTIAGTGTAGFSGDGALATKATLNLPTAITLDSTGNLYLADTRNHRIRRIDAATGILTTIAGNGTQGYAGDGQLATAASLDSPQGLALDAQGNLYLADSHNQHIRRVDVATGILTAVSTGSTTLNLPRGLALDSAGNLYVAEVRGQRVTSVGSGTQGFAGDGQPASAAQLDSPRAVTLSPTGLLTLADTANHRIRQVDSATLIHTIGTPATPATVTLSPPPATPYGTGTITATVISTSATGNVTLSDTSTAAPVVLQTSPLTSNVATFDLSTLTAGLHTLVANYPGDALHTAAQSAPTTVTITPAPIDATPVSIGMLYGQTVPPLTGSLRGVLIRDASSVIVTFASAATQTSTPGSYPITASLSGPSATNYALITDVASVTIGQAPTISTLTLSSSTTVYGGPVGLAIHVASTTSGFPSGIVTILDSGAPPIITTLGSVPLGSAVLDAAGNAALSVTSLAQGVHSLTAIYVGDANFLPGNSAAELETITTNGTAPDFSLQATGLTSQTVASGGSAVFSFVVDQAGAPGNLLNSSVALSASGLPFGATASFSPASIPPGSTSAPFAMTIQTPKIAEYRSEERNVIWLVILLPFLLRMKRQRSAVLALAVFAMLATFAGCGARVNTGTGSSTSPTAYQITVTGTATGPSGAALVHSATVTLNVQ